jgi:hypothetical protein
VALVVGVFAAACLAPYRVDTDTGFQLRSVQQWVAGKTPSPLSLRLPDPRDLSRDAIVRSSWWPPGFPLLYAPLAAAGLSLAWTLRLTSLLLFLAGSLGWVRVARGIGLSTNALCLFSFSLCAYAVTIGGAATLPWADLLTYGAAPWLACASWRLVHASAKPLALFAAGFLLGASYWLKYSLFLTALGMACWALLQTLKGPGGWRDRLARLGALSLGVLLPVAALFLGNLAQQGTLARAVSGNRSDWALADHEPVAPSELLIATAGAPGLALFQNYLPLTHLTYFSDARLSLLRGLPDSERLLCRSLLAIPLTAALVWGLVLGFPLTRNPEIRAFALTTAAAFFLLLLVVSAAVPYDYLAKESRLTVGFMPLLQAIAIGGWLAPVGGRLSVPRTGVLGLVLLPPLLFAAIDFAANQIHDRQPYLPSDTGLFVPELSSDNVPATMRAVKRTIRTPRDVVILVGPPGWGSSLMMWLEFPQRTLPVTTFSAPLGGAYLDASEIRGTTTFRSSRQLRLVLVVSRSVSEGGWLPRIFGRFAGAPKWTPVPMPSRSQVSVWFADMGET